MNYFQRVWPGPAAGDLPRMATGGLLLTAVTFNRYTFRLAGATVKPEHLVIVGLLLWAAAECARSRRIPGLKLFAPLWVLLAVTLLSSVLNAPDMVASLRHTLMLAVVYSGAWLAYYLADTPRRLKWGAIALITLGIFEALMTFAALAADRLGNTFGTQQGNGYIRVPFGTMWEPNILGSYLAAACMLALAYIFSARSGRALLGLGLGLSVMLAALAFSLARTAWVAVVAGGIVVVLTAWRLRSSPNSPPPGRPLLVTLGATLLALAFVAGAGPSLFPTTAGSIFLRIDLSRYRPADDPSVRARATAFNQTLDGIALHPITGNGAGSFAANHVGEKGEPGWIANLELHVLYDSGLTGLGAVMVGLVLLVRGAARSLWARYGPPLLVRPEVAGLLGALVVMAVAYQVTEGTWLAFTWLYMGLLARAVTTGKDFVSPTSEPSGNERQ